MTDVRADIIGAINTLLADHPLEVFNDVPQNADYPLIFIGNIELNTQVDNKSTYEVQGYVEVHLYTGDKPWQKSLVEPYQWLNNLKVRLQPYVSFVLPLNDHHMVWWKLDTDTDFNDISVTEKHYVAQVVYQFEIFHNFTYYDRVSNDGGVVENYTDCVLNKIL